MHNSQIAPAGGKLAVLTPGMGAVATTLFAGVEAIKQGISKPVGSYTQMADIRVGSKHSFKSMKVADLVPMAALDQLVFGGWDLFADNAYEAAAHAGVLDYQHLQAVKPALEKIIPMKAVFDRNFVKRLEGSHVKTGANKMELAEQLRADIRNFMKDHGCDRAVMVWCASTEVYTKATPVQQTVKSFEEGLRQNDPSISPSQIYAYAAMRERVPYANGSPNVSVEMPYMHELSMQMNTPVCGSDFKTGQTLIKTILAPGIRNRQLGVSGWFSTNILGNRDGEVLDDPGSFKSKEVSKTGVLNEILSSKQYPDLYSDLHHIVKINYYRPRGDNKEGWDNIDLFGWMGYPMQLKVNFLCRDSILAAPLVLDLALFMDLAGRANFRGVQDWLSFYFKAPMRGGAEPVDNDLSIQLLKLENVLRHLSKQNIVDHLGLTASADDPADAIAAYLAATLTGLGTGAAKAERTLN